jgi:hypothetical protein
MNLQAIFWDIKSENPLNMPDFPGFLTLARPGMKLKAKLWADMMVKVVVYVIEPINFELNQLRIYVTQ